MARAKPWRFPKCAIVCPLYAGIPWSLEAAEDQAAAEGHEEGSEKHHDQVDAEVEAHLFGWEGVSWLAKEQRIWWKNASQSGRFFAASGFC